MQNSDSAFTQSLRRYFMSSLNFRFYNPVKLIAGDKALESLPYELKQLNSQRPQIITDRGVLVRRYPSLQH